MKRIGAFLQARCISQCSIDVLSSIRENLLVRRPLQQKSSPEGSLILSWCPRRDLNSHVFRQRFLRPPRLPFRHSGKRRFIIADSLSCIKRRSAKWRYRRVNSGLRAHTQRARAKQSGMVLRTSKTKGGSILFIHGQSARLVAPGKALSAIIASE